MPSSESLESSLPETSEKNPISVSKIEVIANPEGIQDDWGPGDAERLAEEGKWMLEQGLLDEGVADLDRYYFPKPDTK